MQRVYKISVQLILRNLVEMAKNRKIAKKNIFTHGICGFLYKIMQNLKTLQKITILIQVIISTENKLGFSSFQKSKKSDFSPLSGYISQQVFQPIPCKHFHYVNNLFSSSYWETHLCGTTRFRSILKNKWGSFWPPLFGRSRVNLSSYRFLVKTAFWRFFADVVRKMLTSKIMTS